MSEWGELVEHTLAGEDLTMRRSQREEVVFGNTVEALFQRALAEQLTPRCRALMREHGIDLDSPLKPAYPRESYFAGLRAVARELHPGVPEETALFELGQRFVSGFEETLIGRAMLSAIRVMGPHTALRTVAHAFRSSNNFMQTQLRELGPGRVELTLSQTSGVPTYFEGVLTAGLRVVGVKEFQVSRLQQEGPRSTFAIQWQA